MKQTQSQTNPYEFSDSNKRYFTYDYYLKRTFGGKVAKIPLDAGFTCPNIDGKCGFGGCIYCSGRGSGDFAASSALSIEEQYAITAEKLSHKWSTERCIPYFQAHTNTYAPLSELKPIFQSALSLPGAVGLNIATRADCLEDDTVEYLAEIAEKTVLTVELGLQTSNDKTAEFINRGHTFGDFKVGYYKLRRASKKINICVHIILGLPGESRQIMLKTVDDVAKLHPNQVKIHLLHVLDGTKLGEIYKRGEYTPLDKSEYVSTVAEALTRLPADTVIARLTGDGMPDKLLAPEWSRKKICVINDIDKYMYENNLWQGKSAGTE